METLRTFKGFLLKGCWKGLCEVPKILSAFFRVVQGPFEPGSSIVESPYLNLPKPTFL